MHKLNPDKNVVKHLIHNWENVIVEFLDPKRHILSTLGGFHKVRSSVGGRGLIKIST